MPITTIHEYLDSYPARRTDLRAIIGTIHPHLTANFAVPFYYGNVGSFWDLLGKAFPQHDFSTLPSILQVLSDYKTWITDIIRQCDRENENVTKDELLYNIVYNTEQIGDVLNESEIQTIYFTSGFGRNNAAKLFTRAFNINYKQTYNGSINEFTIPKDRFGREIRCVVLYSPSGQANRGIAGFSQLYKNNTVYYQQFTNPIKQFKTEFYQDKFQYLNE